jgi:hypothetical protein
VPQKRFRSALDPVEYILFETNFCCKLALGETSERLISSVPPVKHQKPMNAGRFAELSRKSYAATDLAVKDSCPKGVDVFFDNTGGSNHDAVMRNLAIGARVIDSAISPTFHEG